MEVLRRDFLRLAAGAAMLPCCQHPHLKRMPLIQTGRCGLGTVFIDNQPGAGGSIAAQLVAHAAPDGYTIFLGNSSIHLAEMILREHPLLDPMKDLVPISMVAITCFAITVHPSVPVENLNELIAYIRANPGKLSYGRASIDGSELLHCKSYR